MSEIRVWKARDGQLFESKTDYLKHEAMMDLGQELYDDQLYFHGSLNVDNGFELAEFLERHRESILKVLGAAV